MNFASAPAILDGVRVLDLTSVVFGPYCTQVLADLGAQVIKVEPPGLGDAFRHSAKPAATQGMAPAFMALNKGKKSAALDLKNPADRAIMLELAREADIFVVNVRGKALERLGLDYAALKAVNEGLIYVHCVGFGQNGPYADLQAYDDVIQAATGTTSLLPRVDGDPRPRYLPSLVADKVAGLHGAYAAMAGLFHKHRTGEGQYIEVPMFEVFSSFILREHLGGISFDPANGPAGYFRQLDPDRQPFATADGHISIVAYTDDAWQRIFAMLEQPGFLDQPHLASAKQRYQAQAELYQAIARFTPAFTTDELLRRCHAAQIPAQAARDLQDVMSDPHLAATGFFRRVDHPTEGRFHDMAPPVRFSAMPTAPEHFTPLLGEQTASVRSHGWGAFCSDEPGSTAAQDSA